MEPKKEIRRRIWFLRSATLLLCLLLVLLSFPVYADEDLESNEQAAVKIVEEQSEAAGKQDEQIEEMEELSSDEAAKELNDVDVPLVSKEDDTVKEESDANKVDEPEAKDDDVVVVEKPAESDSNKRSAKSPHSSHESSNLSDFLTNVVIVGAVQDDSGAYVVEKNTDYSILCSFAESSSHQFDNDAPLIYYMPPGVVILNEQTGQMEIDIVYKGRTYRVDSFYDLTTDGALTIQFDQNDPDYLRLVESTNVSFRFSYYASFDGTETHIHFADGIERDLIFTEGSPGEAYVRKTGRFDEETGRFYYTVKVTAHGDVEQVNVKDDLLGNALVFNGDVQITGNSSSYTNNGSTTGFDYTFASMSDGEEITITYSANVNFGVDSNNDGVITVDQTKNSVRVDPEPGDPHTSEYSRQIRYKYAVKNAGEESGTTAGGDKIIDWSIDYNPLALAAVGGDTVTDTIASDSTDYMTYYGSGIAVEVKDHNGTVIRTDNISYENLSSHSPSSWTYTIPTSDNQPYSYHITYQTVVDMDAVEGYGAAVTLNNTANGSSNSIGIIPESAVHVDKEVESYTTEEVNWITTLWVPQHGLTSAVVTDTVPARYFDGAMHYDFYDPASLDITGLSSDEGYEVSTSTGSVIITFYYMEGTTKHYGLRGEPGGRNVIVRLRTLVDQDWLDKGYGDKTFETHMNTINFNGVSDTAYVIYGKPGIEKTGEYLGNGSFLYTIMIDGLEEEHLTIEDTFDRSLLEVDTSKVGDHTHMCLHGGTQWSQIWGETPVSYTDTTTGMILDVAHVPKDDHGQYYPYYRLTYYLKLKPGVDLDALARANGGSYDVDNTAIWGDYTSTFTYKVKYDYMDKELLNKDELGGISRTAQYKITFNSEKITLNHGTPITVTDVLSANLSVDYGSIKIVTDPAGLSVPYSLRGGRDEHGVPDGTTVATYTVPDHTKVVITYDAFVRGDGEQTITNKVSALDDEEVVEDTKDYGAASEGQGAIASFRIVKVDGNDANNKLEGVKFKVYAQNDELDFGERNDFAKEIILETDEDGEILFDGDKYDFYFDELYYVEEIDPPPGYGRLDTIYNVTLTADMSRVNYGRYIYYYNDSMQIKNWPLEGLVIEKQVESSDATDKEKNYTFRVYILNADGTVNTDYNEVNGDDQFTNGMCEFQIKDGQQKMFWGFTRGTKYRVEEVDADGFVTTVTYDVFDENGNVIETVTENDVLHTGTLTQTEELVLFTNSKTDTIVPTGIRYRNDMLLVLFAFFTLIAIIRIKQKLSADE